MKRTPLKRFTELRSSKPIRPVNRERKVRLVEKQFGVGSGYYAFLLSHDCMIPDCGRRKIIYHQSNQSRGCRTTVAAHAKSRGAGGTWMDTVPLCWFHHSEQHAMGIGSFQRKYRIDMAAIANRMVGEWESMRKEEHDGR